MKHQSTPAASPPSGGPPCPDRSGSSPPATPGERCRVDVVQGSGPQLSREIESLLRRRLRLAAPIMLVGFGLFLVRNLFAPPETPGLDRAAHLFHAGVVAVVAAVAAVVWSRRPLPSRWLRAQELVLFGVAAAFFAWLDFTVFHGDKVLRLAAAGHEPIVVRFAAGPTTYRWVALIILYGTFIPNTWRRCAVLVGVLDCVPLLLLGGLALGDDPSGLYPANLLPDVGIMLLVASAIAVFGSYKIRELHEKAFEAQKLGRYRLQKLLGAGGMGEVYLAEHLLLRRPCAIKLIRPAQAGDPKTLRRFEREVQTTATLTHPNTVEIYDYGHTEDGTFYYVMEYLPGLSLDDLVERHGPVPPERAVHLLRQVCQALREAHAVGLIHRDIKPGNIIACERGKVYDVAKLLDFGLVRHAVLGDWDARLTAEGVVSGSPGYLSPEQALGKPEVDARCDLYSLGGVAYHLVTGRLPFERPTLMEMLLAHARDPVVPVREVRADVPADLAAVIMRCLEKDPGQRFPDAESLEKALAACQCAGRWTQDRAAEWWRKQARELPASSLPDPGDEATSTLLVKHQTAP
jgi:hypothetical protein